MRGKKLSPPRIVHERLRDGEALRVPASVFRCWLGPELDAFQKKIDDQFEAAKRRDAAITSEDQS